MILTGASGFIGSAVLRALLERGARLPVESRAAGVHALAARETGKGAVRVLLWSFAPRTPPAARVEMRARGLPSGRWEARRTWLDAAAAPDSRGERLRSETPRALDDPEGAVLFDLPPYGASLITYEER